MCILLHLLEESLQIGTLSLVLETWDIFRITVTSSFENGKLAIYQIKSVLI